MGKHVLTTDRTRWAALTPPRRKALYAVIAAVLTLGAAYGGWTAETADQWAKVADQVLGALALFLATAHTDGVYESPVYGERDSEESGK